MAKLLPLVLLGCMFNSATAQAQQPTAPKGSSTFRTEFWPEQSELRLVWDGDVKSPNADLLPMPAGKNEFGLEYIKVKDGAFIFHGNFTDWQDLADIAENLMAIEFANKKTELFSTGRYECYERTVPGKSDSPSCAAVARKMRVHIPK